MSDDWDAEDFEPTPIATSKQPVKESWEDEEEEEKEPPAPEPSKPTEPSEKKKKKKIGEKAEEVVQHSEPLADPIAEKLRQQRLVEESDFKSTKELFGTGKKDSNERSLDDFIPKSEEDFVEFAELLASKATPYAKSFHYTLLLKTFLRKAEASIGSKEAKEVSAAATVLWNEKLKAEKEAEKGKKKTGAKKTQLTVDKEEDDYRAAPGGYGPDDDYDFM